MILNPITAYRLAAEAERAHEALKLQPLLGGRSLDLKVFTILARLQSARNYADALAAERDAALAKIARMTGNLKRGSAKVQS